MAASLLSVVRTTLKGTHLVPGPWLLTQSSQTQAVRPSLRLYCSRIEPQRNSDGGRAQEKAQDPEEPEGPEYIPQRKAKNPMTKIGFAWIIGLPASVICFFLAKMQVDKNRQKQLKSRQRMKRSNEGEYERSRYRHHGPDVKVN